MLLVLSVAFCFEALAGVVDFEDGVDGGSISSSIEGLEFSVTGGKQWVYGDFQTDRYNGPYPNGAYYAGGNFFAWLGPHQGVGEITFTLAQATYFTIGYSAQNSIVLEAYDDTGSLLDSQTGTVNLGTGQMDFLTVSADSIGYVRISEGTGFTNLWIIDEIDTDATIHCTEDEECDDGDLCNGQETCLDYTCIPADTLPCQDDSLFCNGEEFCNTDENKCDRTDPPCPEDGEFCNGVESCSEELDSCRNSGNPCLGGQTCNEILDECEDEEDDEEEPGADPDDLWPKGQVSGGCCGC